jgi:hypothetical protein
MSLHDLWLLFQTDWHKIGILFLVLKELKIFMHIWKFLQGLYALRTKKARRALWKKVMKPFKKV